MSTSNPDINTLWPDGKVIKGYTMLKEGHEGSNSVWGKAKSPEGQTVFFKKYTSPSSLFDPWYRGYVEYQKEIKRRIDEISVIDQAGRNQGPTYRFIEFFELPGPDGVPEEQKSPDYYQVLEFIEGAKDLEDYLSSPDTTWNDRRQFASVFMFAMKTLHNDKVRIIHTDLKPKNLLLIPTQRADGSKTYQIKIIDLDVTILSDKQAPWHGYGEQYIGSPGYYSPEHLRGQVPTEKSDVFTCGLILYEILTTNGHPYNRVSDLAVYEAYCAPVSELRGSYGSVEKDAAVAQMLHRTLDPNPDNRPTALEVQRVLIGGGPVRVQRPQQSLTLSEVASPLTTATPVSNVQSSPVQPVSVSTLPSTTSITSEPPVANAQPDAAPASTISYFKLKTERSTEGIRVFPDSRIGYKFLELIESEGKKYYSREHFSIHHRDGKWYIWHCAPAGENKTAVNGVLVSGELELHNGDIITAASQDGSKTVMPLIVELGG